MIKRREVLQQILMGEGMLMSLKCTESICKILGCSRDFVSAGRSCRKAEGGAMAIAEPYVRETPPVNKTEADIEAVMEEAFLSLTRECPEVADIRVFNTAQVNSERALCRKANELLDKRGLTKIKKDTAPGVLARVKRKYGVRLIRHFEHDHCVCPICGGKLWP
jgi:hypothetical protein